VCPTRYRTRHFFNNSNTSEDITTKFEQEYVRCVGNAVECVCSRCNVLISGKIIKEMSASVASGTPFIYVTLWLNFEWHCNIFKLILRYIFFVTELSIKHYVSVAVLQYYLSKENAKRTYICLRSSTLSRAPP